MPTPELPPHATLADVGEDVLVAALAEFVASPEREGQDAQDQAGQGDHVLVGPGDDAAVLRVRTGHVVVSTDAMVEGRHFRREWVDAADVGHRAGAQNLADITAMGGLAHSVTLTLAAPDSLPVSWVIDLARGLAEECALVGARVVGGDVTGADQIMVSVTALGSCQQAPVLRDGAAPGDVLALHGRQGWAAAGLAVLGRGFRSPRALVDAYRRPEVPYRAGSTAAQAGATAMIDVSDGLVIDAGRIAVASGVAVDLRRDAFSLPEPLESVGRALNTDPMRFVLGGGDDHALLAAFETSSSVPPGWTVVGEVREGEGVTVDGKAYTDRRGWSHF